MSNRSVGIFFMMFLFLSFITVPHVSSEAKITISLDVKYYGEEIQGHIINRQISINETNITVSGFTYNLNNSWPVENSTENASFPAIWVEPVYQAFNNCLPVPEEVFWKYDSDGKKMLIFAADWNGTHYKEAVIIGSITGVWGVSLISSDNKSDVEYGADIIIYEKNRTLYASSNASSLYNPSYAVFKAVNYMNSKNWTFDNVTDIFLIPQEYVLDRFKDYEFVWSMLFFYTLNTTAKEKTELTHFVISPNGTILDVTHLRLRPARIGGACGGCTSSNWLSNYQIYVYSAIGVFIIGLVLVIVYLKVYKRKETVVA